MTHQLEDCASNNVPCSLGAHVTSHVLLSTCLAPSADADWIEEVVKKKENRLSSCLVLKILGSGKHTCRACLVGRGSLKRREGRYLQSSLYSPVAEPLSCPSTYSMSKVFSPVTSARTLSFGVKRYGVCVWCYAKLVDKGASVIGFRNP